MTGTLTKAEITENLANNFGLSKKESKGLVENFFEVIKCTLEKGASVKISGLGNFVLRDKKERPGRNPKTGEGIPVTARRVVTFHGGEKLKAKIRQYVGKEIENE